MEINHTSLTPFIKWAGGKRQLLPELKRYIPLRYHRYYEPFIGGGALFLYLQPEQASISDLNEELILTWQVIKDNPSELLFLLAEHQVNDNKEYYLHIRSADRDGRLQTMSSIERAARFIYLNKAGFNGLWRVNQKGQHNVPYANPKVLNLVMSDNIYTLSEYLNQYDINIYHQSYIETISNAMKGDFIYFDPPYVPLTSSSSFTSYTKEGFTLKDQEQLRDITYDLTQRGVKVMISNSSSPLVYELYQDNLFYIHEVKAKRVINSKGNERGTINEVIITNYRT